MPKMRHRYRHYYSVVCLVFPPRDMLNSDMLDRCIYCRDTRYVQKQRATPEWSCANCGNQFTDKEYRECLVEWYRKSEERAAAIKARELAEQSQKPPLLVSVLSLLPKIILGLPRSIVIHALVCLFFYFAAEIVGLPLKLIGLVLSCVGLVGFGFCINRIRTAHRFGNLWRTDLWSFVGGYVVFPIIYLHIGIYLVLLD